jgi:hypothetical protein
MIEIKKFMVSIVIFFRASIMKWKMCIVYGEKSAFEAELLWNTIAKIIGCICDITIEKKGLFVSMYTIWKRNLLLNIISFVIHSSDDINFSLELRWFLIYIINDNIVWFALIQLMKELAFFFRIFSLHEYVQAIEVVDSRSTFNYALIDG